MTGLFDLLGFRLEADAPSARAVPKGRTGKDTAASELSVAVVVRAVRARLGLFLVTAVALAGAGAFVVLKRVVPTYRAEAVLLVEPTAPVLAYTGEEWRAESIVGFYGDYVRTLKGMAVEPRILKDAIDRLAREGVVWCPPGVTPIDRPNHLRARLDVSHVRDSYLVTIGLEDREAAVPAEVVNIVTEVFLASLTEDQRSGSRARLELLEQERARLEQEVEGNRLRIEELSAETGFAILDERQNVFYERLIRLQDGLTDVFVDRVRAEGQYEGSVAQAAELRAAIPVGEVRRLLDEDDVVQDARLMFQRLVRDLESETGDLSEDHPLRLQAQERVDAARARLTELEQDTLARITERVGQAREDLAHSLVESSRQELESARRSEGRMQEVVREAETQLEVYGRAVLVGRALRADADRLLATLETVNSRIEELVLESQAPERVTLRTPATAPTKPVSDRRMLALLTAGLFAAAAAAVVTVALELRRATPRTKAAKATKLRTPKTSPVTS